MELKLNCFREANWRAFQIISLRSGNNCQEPRIGRYLVGFRAMQLQSTKQRTRGIFYST